MSKIVRLKKDCIRVDKDEVIKRLSNSDEMILLKDEILNTPHNIIEKNKQLYWEETEPCDNINEPIDIFYKTGVTKNHEEFRNLYRKIGVSLYLYWDVFYWDMNNEDAENYIYNKDF